MDAATETSTLLFTSVTEITEVLLPVELETLADCLLAAAILAVAGSVDEETSTEVACPSPKNQEVATG